MPHTTESVSDEAAGVATEAAEVEIEGAEVGGGAKGDKIAFLNSASAEELYYGEKK